MGEGAPGVRGGIRAVRMDSPSPPGLFSPRCAVCGRDRLETLSGEHTGANAGFCPSCGIFVCFECAGKAGWLDWKKTCPTCGGRLRENTLLIVGAMFTILFAAILVPMLITLEIPNIQQGDIERGWLQMAASGPADLEEGKLVKIVGTVAGTADEPISPYYESTGESGHWHWNAHDFMVNTTDGPVNIRASILDLSSVRSGWIIGSDMGHGGYHRGSGVVVVGKANGTGPNASVEPVRIAPSNDALHVHNNPYSFPALVLSMAAVPLAPLSLWRLIARYRCHRMKVADYGPDRSARPLGSVDELIKKPGD